MARILDVYLNGHLVGELEQDDSGALWFCYDESWLVSEKGRPLSASLPLRPERFKRNECRAFFAGLLPEEESRQLVAKAFGVSARNDFALLSKIGGECAGAVSVMARGEKPGDADQNYSSLSLVQLEKKFEKLPLRPLLAGEQGMRLSLAGAQGKLAVMIQDGEYFLTLNGAPSSHILKPESPHYSGLVRNESFCMSLAKKIGLDVADVSIGRAGEIPFLEVTRFDRKWDVEGHLERIHQEDFCQAMGIAPEMKYQQEGGPNLKQCFALVREISSMPGVDLLRLFDAVVFNHLIGNNDAHGKNFSFLYHETGARLAPLYDLVCTRAYPDLSDEMAMKIGGERKPSRLRQRNWEKFYEDAGLSPAAASKRRKSLGTKIEKLLNENPQKGDPESEIFGIIRGNLPTLSTE